MQHSYVKSFINTCAALATGVCLFGGCRPDPSKLYGRTFLCDSTITTDQCGTGADGRPMTCFAASQLGGADFCVDSCDGAAPVEQDSGTCLSSGAHLQGCRPAQQGPAEATARQCGDGLS